jgi:hypothetical protein
LAELLDTYWVREQRENAVIESMLVIKITHHVKILDAHIVAAKKPIIVIVATITQNLNHSCADVLVSALKLTALAMLNIVAVIIDETL